MLAQGKKQKKNKEKGKDVHGIATIPAVDQGDEVTQSFMDERSTAVVFTGSSAHIGTRAYQEDSFYVTEPACEGDDGFLKAYGIVCDGMGGLENGDKASRLATDLMRDVFDSILPDDPIEARLLNEIDAIDFRVKEECGFGNARTAGTTLAAALIMGNQLHWIGVGDSRVYVIRADEIVQVTRDHTFMLTLEKDVEDGLISREEMESNPQRGALISFVGSGNIKYINTNKAGLDLLHGDIVLLCSDGLTKSLADERIAAIARGHFGDMKEAAHQLTLQSFDSGDGAKDNTTVVLMQYLV